MIKKLLFLIVTVTLVYSVVNACDMSAMIAKRGTSLSILPQIGTNNAYSSYNDPYDFIAFVMNRSNASLQNDGYGILYYPQNQYSLDSGNYWYKYIRNTSDLNRVYYTGNYFNPQNSPDVLDEAKNWIMSEYADAAIVMAHARKASSNPFAPGNHPFRMNANGRTYSMVHNGHISTSARVFMINETNVMHPDWFSTHLPNYTGFANAAYPAYWIDSEVMFHYLMCHILACDNNVLTGIKVALKKLRSELKLSTNVANFIFSDGESLYAFRSSPLTGSNSGYKLCYREVGSFYGIRTGSNYPGETVINPMEMVVFSRDRAPEVYPDFLREGFESGYQYDYEPAIHANRDAGAIISSDHLNIDISFVLDKSTQIRLRIFNQKGQFVRLLTNSRFAEGPHLVVWDGTDDNSKRVSRGVYFLEMQAGQKRTVSKVLLLGG